MNIPMLDLKREYLFMKAEIDAAIERCLGHQQWILGAEVDAFERDVAGYLGVKHAIGVSSGTEALVLSLRALAITKKGREFFEKEDLVVTTPFTFTATGSSILRAGATPFFIDIDPKTFNLDLRILEEVVKKNPRIVGIIPVHLFGESCDMDAIRSIAARRDLFIVEDVAQAFGAGWNGKRCGTFGDTGAFSFFPSKNLGAFGDGGLITTNDDRLSEILRMLMNHGGKNKYSADYLGFNARLDALQAAILRVRLKYVDGFNEKRRLLAQRYGKAFSNSAFIETPSETPGARHVFHQYTIRVKRGLRDAFKKFLEENGISSMVYYPAPLHRMALFSNAKASLPLRETDLAASEVVSLPIEPLFESHEADAVCSIVNRFRAA